MPGSPINKINNLLTRAVFKLLNVDRDTKEWKGADPEVKGKLIVQVLGLSGEVISDVEYLQQYGIRSIPLDGSRGILLAYGGNKDNATVICVDDKRFGQFTLQPGDFCIYSKNGAHTIYRDNDIIEILSGEKTITIGGMVMKLDSSGLTMTGGDIKTDGEVIAKTGGTAIPLSTHKQTGSPTAPDGPVSNTGAPIP